MRTASYDLLWKKLIDVKMNKTESAEKAGIAEARQPGWERMKSPVLMLASGSAIRRIAILWMLCVSFPLLKIHDVRTGGRNGGGSSC